MATSLSYFYTFLNRPEGRGIEPKEIKELPVDYLNVKYTSKKTASGKKEYWITGIDTDYEVKLEDASSGMQTIIPSLLIAEYFS